MKVGIVGGCGAAGSVLAASLARAGADVQVIARGRSGCERARLVVEGLWSGPVDVCGWDGVRGATYDFLIVATKAYDVGQALDLVASSGLGAGLVLSTQNGLGSLEEVERRFGDRAAAMILYYGSYRTGACSSRYTGGSRVVLGCRTGCDVGRLRSLSSALNSGGLEAEVVGREELEGHRWLKLAVNSAINPVTALAWDTNGVIVRDGEAAEAAAILAQETGRVAGELGIALPDDPVEATFRTARETSNNCSSTVQDLAAGRPTELRYINLAVWEASASLSERAIANFLAFYSVEAASRWLRGRRSPCER